MKIIDILKSGKVTVSCELFPPKAGAELEGAKQVVRRMAELKPSFMSVTYQSGYTHKHCHIINLNITVYF